MHGTSAFGAEKVTVTLSVAASPSGAPVVLSIFTTGNGTLERYARTISKKIH